MPKIILIILIIFSSLLNGQDLSEKYAFYGQFLKLELKNAAFPHPDRKKGYDFKEHHFDFQEHYKDSSVGVFIPKNYKSKNKINFVVHFHGWYNHIDSVLSTFQIIEQFAKSKVNAVLIIPQGAKNVPDSFGGKLEEKGGFQRFIDEILGGLNQRNINMPDSIGRIVLSGHSGAYRLISYILLRGGLLPKIDEVYLFDAFYGHTEKYTYWLDNNEVRLINIFTKKGGTLEQSQRLIEDLQGWGIEYSLIRNDNFAPDDLQQNKIIFIESDLGHNQVIHANQQFYKFLSSSRLPKIK